MISTTNSYSTLDDKKGFVVVELFTSEGCSSCPPADELVNEMEAEAERNGQEIFVINFHVDYWNYLGWKDPFSAKEFTNRQYSYATYFGKGKIYTPQIVVNGAKQFVGSNRTTLLASLETELSHPNKSSINFSDVRKNSTTANIDYKLSSQSDATVLNYVLIEKDVISNVLAGENRGEKLYHRSVVRKFDSTKNPSAEGHFEIEYNFTTKNKYTVIAYLQNIKDGRIIAATRYNL